MKRAYAMYHVGLKVLLKKGDEFLFLTDAVGKHFDLPGGRIDDVEHTTPLTEVIAREVGEELGEDVAYKLGKPAFQFRRHLESKGWHVFLTVYEAEYVSGKIELSAEHSSFQWINPRKVGLKEEQFFHKHKEEYFAFKKYFENLV
ncbi:MAG: NUDIX hydrolase [bacterium]|nr:NUDIX hydrolase [bacterium]